MSRPPEIRRMFPRHIGGYRMPDPFLRDDECERLTLADLAGMGPEQLWLEKKRLEFALLAVQPHHMVYAVGPEPRPARKWLLERFAAVRAEIDALSVRVAASA